MMPVSLSVQSFFGFPNARPQVRCNRASGEEAGRTSADCRLLFGRVGGFANRALRRKGTSLRLLHDVSQFMRDQLPAAGRMGLILSLAKDQPFSDGKGAGVHSACRPCRLASNVNAGTAEIVTETGLHKCSR